jgi:hypothetical protein
MTFGASIALGDINRDSALDLVVGSPQHDAKGLDDAGRISVFLGPLVD